MRAHNEASAYPKEVAMQTVQDAPARERDTRSAEPRHVLPLYEEFDKMPIAGVWRAGRAGRVEPDRDPYTGGTLVEIPLGNVADVDDAFRSAERAQRSWAAVGPEERRTLMEHAALIVELRKDEIIDWLIRESGSTYVKALWEWEITLQELRESAGRPFHVAGRLLPASVRGKDSYVHRRPVGVVSIISPWNFPLYLTVRSLAPALAVGNAAVVKPASDTPVTGGLLLARIFEEAGLPQEVLSVVVGSSRDIGDSFTDHPVPRVVSFTGSTPVGRRIGEHAGRAVKRVCPELGGNCPFIVLDDAHLHKAADAAVAGTYFHQGQICIRVNRILVDRKVRDEFRDIFVEHVKALKVGNPFDVDTAIGPIINQSQLDKIVRLVDATVARGASALVRGTPEGLMLPPIVLDGVTNDMPAAREEVFGPVGPLVTFSGDDDAVRLANDTEYGLSSAVFGGDVERAMRVARRIDAGMTHINDWPVNVEANTAFGGEKQSGVGRFGGEWAIREFTTDHWISVQDIARAYPI
jgi:aldehyde dehydrogenase (NAD+)